LSALARGVVAGRLALVMGAGRLALVMGVGRLALVMGAGRLALVMGAGRLALMTGAELRRVRAQGVLSREAVRAMVGPAGKRGLDCVGLRVPLAALRLRCCPNRTRVARSLTLRRSRRLLAPKTWSAKC
jgi:hypothetical protein